MMLAAENIVIKCPSCQSKLAIPSSAYGKKVRCTKCKKIIEFFNPTLFNGLKQTYKDYDFKETGHRIEATGVCKNCQTKK